SSSCARPSRSATAPVCNHRGVFVSAADQRFNSAIGETLFGLRRRDDFQSSNRQSSHEFTSLGGQPPRCWSERLTRELRSNRKYTLDGKNSFLIDAATTAD